MSKYGDYDDCDDYVFRKSDLKYFYLQLQQQKQQQEQFQAQLQLQQQKQEQLQAQAQAQNDTDNTSFNNIGNPVVNVHVNSNDGNNGGNGSKPASAFRAIKDTETQISANFVYDVSFESIEFDLDNEYDANTSTFTAKTDGVYLFTAALGFSPDANDDFQFGVVLKIDGVSINYDDEFTGVDAINVTVVDFSQIIKLNAGQTVSIGAVSDIPGRLQTFFTTFSFAGVRLAELSGVNPPPLPPLP